VEKGMVGGFYNDELENHFYYLNCYVLQCRGAFKYVLGIVMFKHGDSVSPILSP